MTIDELTQALAEKGYTWIEKPRGPYQKPAIIAVKNGKETFVGQTSLLLESGIDYFKRNEVYKRL